MSTPSIVKVDKLVKNLEWGTYIKEYSIIPNIKCARELNTRY
jgi:hypothetical protein